MDEISYANRKGRRATDGFNECSPGPAPRENVNLKHWIGFW